MRKFDYSFLNKETIPEPILALLQQIAELKIEADIKKGRHPQICEEMRGVARVQSVKNSSAMEGISASDERINAIVTQYSVSCNRNEEEIAGYRDAWDAVTLGYKHIKFDTEGMLYLHRRLLPPLEPGENGPYRYDGKTSARVKPNLLRTGYFTVSAEEIPSALEQLSQAYARAREEGVPPLLMIPCIMLDFLCVQPFQEANGRISRLLTLLLLLQCGWDVGKYISLEEQIRLCKSVFTRTRRQSSWDWDFNGNDYYPFIEIFLLVLRHCYEEFHKRCTEPDGKKITKQDRVEAVILNSFAPLSKMEIYNMVSDVSPNTVNVVLSALEKEGKIRRIGRTRNTKYVRVS